MSGNKRQGQGTLKWIDGAVYTGDWVNDCMHGQGRIAFPNGSVYTGAFTNNNPNGQGELKTINGEMLQGHFQFMGRSANTFESEGPVGSYTFSGTLVSPGAPNTIVYRGPMTLHLSTGLVGLPGMANHTHLLLPFAVQASAVTGDDAAAQKLARETGGNVPTASVATTGAPVSNTMAYTADAATQVGLNEEHMNGDDPCLTACPPRSYDDCRRLCVCFFGQVLCLVCPWGLFSRNEDWGPSNAHQGAAEVRRFDEAMHARAANAAAQQSFDTAKGTGDV